MVFGIKKTWIIENDYNFHDFNYNSINAVFKSNVFLIVFVNVIHNYVRIRHRKFGAEHVVSEPLKSCYFSIFYIWSGPYVDHVDLVLSFNFLFIGLRWSFLHIIFIHIIKKSDLTFSCRS